MRGVIWVITIYWGLCNTACLSETKPCVIFLTPLRQVTKITDGDTFYVADSTQKGEKVRLIGIDAPESRSAFRKEAHPFGPEATRYLRKLVEGKKVYLEYDVRKKDQYNRTLAYVFLEDSTFVNAEMIQNGYAILMTIPPNIKYANLFYQLQQQARTNKRGIWAYDLEE
ncbi:MAG TPA: thermonuclease family protein [Chitinophagales bacterium]|nr:thermonuclease family protein [Chitinophagales bacterium]HRK28403.1 thermonuclease family protein [Chitinophagales bacterium]